MERAAVYAAGRLPICTVIGFPNGYSTTETKVFETRDAVAKGADYIKTSTGFAAGGATFADVELMRRHVGPQVKVKVKAAGGIASFDDAEEFLCLGADRLGTSRLVRLEKAE